MENPRKCATTLPSRTRKMLTSAVKMTKNHSGLIALPTMRRGTRDRTVASTSITATGMRPQGAGAKNTLTMKTTMMAIFTRGSSACRGDLTL